MSDKEPKSEHTDQYRSKKEETSDYIRYVPVDIRAIEEGDSDIDLIEILKTFWDGRKTIYKTVTIFTIIGIFIALFSINEYTSQVKLLPESQQSNSLGGLGGLAQQFGFSASPQQQSEGIPSILYPEIIQSNIFLADLMKYEVPLSGVDNEVTLKEYFQKHQDTSVLHSILKYTVYLPFTLKDWLSSEEADNSDMMVNSIGEPEKLKRLMRLPQSDWVAIRNLRNSINIENNTETGVVTISVNMQDPVITATVADEIVQRLSEYVMENRTEKARRDVEFIEERFKEAKNDFEEAQQELAAFNDANRGQLTAMARTEEQLLQSRYNLNFNIYNSLAERLEDARIKLQEETPVISVIEPAAVLNNPSAPDRPFIVISFAILGTLLGTIVILVRPFFGGFFSR